MINGDSDLEAAIARTHSLGKAVPLVVFGHMHHKLIHTKARLRTPVVVRNETVYLNAAIVPRIVNKQGARLRNFVIVEHSDNRVTSIASVWLNSDRAIVNSEIFYQEN